MKHPVAGPPIIESAAQHSGLRGGKSGLAAVRDFDHKRRARRLQLCLEQALLLVSTAASASVEGNVWQPFPARFALLLKGFTASIEVTS